MSKIHISGQEIFGGRGCDILGAVFILSHRHITYGHVWGDTYSAVNYSMFGQASKRSHKKEPFVTCGLDQSHCQNNSGRMQYNMSMMDWICMSIYVGSQVTKMMMLMMMMVSRKCWKRLLRRHSRCRTYHSFCRLKITARMYHCIIIMHLL